MKTNKQLALLENLKKSNATILWQKSVKMIQLIILVKRSKGWSEDIILR